MSTRNKLIKLGSATPSLRPHIRRILAQLPQQEYTADEMLEIAQEWLRSGVDREIRQALTKYVPATKGSITKGDYGYGVVTYPSGGRYSLQYSVDFDASSVIVPTRNEKSFYQSASKSTLKISFEIEIKDGKVGGALINASVNFGATPYGKAYEHVHGKFVDADASKLKFMLKDSIEKAFENFGEFFDAENVDHMSEAMGRRYDEWDGRGRSPSASIRPKRR